MRHRQFSPKCEIVAVIMMGELFQRGAVFRGTKKERIIQSFCVQMTGNYPFIFGTFLCYIVQLWLKTQGKC